MKFKKKIDNIYKEMKKEEEEKLCKYIYIKRKENEKILDKEIKDSKNFLFNYLVKNNYIFYSKTALEIDLGLDITLPIYIISNKDTITFKDIFDKMNKKYKYAYKLLPLTHKDTYIYDFRLIRYLIIYKINYEKNIIDKKDYKYVDPILSLGNIYFTYSTPIYNTPIFKSFSNVEQIYLKKIYNLDIKIKDDIKILDKNKYIKKLENKYIKDNKNVLITGIKVYNDFMKTNIIDSIDVIVSKIRLKDEYEKIKNIYNDVKINKLMINKCYFTNVYEIIKDDKCIIRLYETDLPFSYYKKFNRSNYHTVLFILLFKYNITNNTLYLNLVYNLIYKAKNKNVLKNNKFQCFQSTFVKNALNDFYKIKEKIIKVDDL